MDLKLSNKAYKMAKSKHMRNEQRTMRVIPSKKQAELQSQERINQIMNYAKKELYYLTHNEKNKDIGGPIEISIDENSRIMKIIKGSDSYKNIMKLYSKENIMNIEPLTEKIRNSVQTFRVRGIFYYLDENKTPHFMLNYKASKRTKHFLELSFKGELEIDYDSNFYDGFNRELVEEMPDIYEKVSRTLIGGRGLYFNTEDDEKNNSDILVLKDETSGWENYILNIIVTGITQVKKPFYPELTEHSRTLWAPLEETQILLWRDAMITGNDKDYLLSMNLLPYLTTNLTTKHEVKDRYKKEIKDTNYIKFPEPTAKLYKPKSNPVVYGKG